MQYILKFTLHQRLAKPYPLETYLDLVKHNMKSITMTPNMLGRVNVVAIQNLLATVFTIDELQISCETWTKGRIDVPG